MSTPPKTPKTTPPKTPKSECSLDQSDPGERSGGAKAGGNKKRTGKGRYEFVKALTSLRYRDEYFDFKFKDIVKTIKESRELFMKETMLFELGTPAAVVGDLHGQYHDLLRVFNFSNEQEPGKPPRPGYLRQRFVFMGDYVDRGKNSLEVVMLLLNLKILFPKSYALLRGNHETRTINRVYGFYAELVERFDKAEGQILFDQFNELFSHMPIACLVGGSILCMHGGISPHLTSLDDIRNIPKPLMDTGTNKLACDLLWSDPMFGLKGHKNNAVRGISIHFGEDLLNETMKKLGLTLVVRGHQMMMNGFCFFAKQRLVTVFTAASYYPDKPNHGAIMHISKDGRVGFKIIAPPNEKESGVKVFRGDHDAANDYDDGYQYYTGPSPAALAAAAAAKKSAAAAPAPAAPAAAAAPAPAAPAAPAAKP